MNVICDASVAQQSAVSAGTPLLTLLCTAAVALVASRRCKAVRISSLHSDTSFATVNNSANNAPAQKQREGKAFHPLEEEPWTNLFFQTGCNAVVAT